MMNAFTATAWVASIIYGIFVDSRLMYIFFAILIPFLVITQVLIKPHKENSTRRGTAISSWSHPVDPSTYVVKDFNTEKAMAYLEKINSLYQKEDPSNPRVTLNHLITKGIAWAAHKQRRDIGRIVFGFFKPAKSIGITIICNQDGGRDLVPVTIWDTHTKSLLSIAKDLSIRVNRAKNNTDKDFTKAAKPFKVVPTCIMQPLMHIIVYFAANLGISIPGSNVNPEKMGHIMLSNLGSLGIEVGFAPLCSPTFTQLVVCTGKKRKIPVYDKKSDSIIAKEIMSSVFTFDHRYGDGAIAASFIAVMQDYIEDPDNFEPSKFKDNISVEEREIEALADIFVEERQKSSLAAT